MRRRVFAAAPQPRIVVVQALVKGERSELAVELLTEVGVDEIVPWAAAALRGDVGARAFRAGAGSRPRPRPPSRRAAALAGDR